MSYEFRMPNINGRTAEEQVAQLVSFLRQHIQELNFAMKSMDSTRQEDKK